MLLKMQAALLPKDMNIQKQIKTKTITIICKLSTKVNIKTQFLVLEEYNI